MARKKQKTGGRRRGRQETNREASRGAGSRAAAVARTWGLFLALLVVLRGIEELYRDAIRETAILVNARIAAAALRGLGAEAQAQGALVTSSIFDFEIIFECTAVYPMGLFVAAVLATPAGWRARGTGLLVGLPALAVLNLVRILSLIAIGHWFRPAFETAHLVVWQSLMVFFTALLWLAWALTLTERNDARPA